MNSNYTDVLIVGAGLSGICAAYHLQTQNPNKSFAILESRDAIGGTWDLFKYPGIRSDSDMYTFGFPFRPWTGKKSVASGGSILQYLRDTAAEFGIDKKINFRHKVQSANWSSAQNKWTLLVEKTVAQDRHETIELRCKYLMMCSGYYRYDQAYRPEFKGEKNYKGTLVHPQFWPQDLDYENKKVAIIGSGATAVTLTPTLAEKAEHVTQIQRSPTYVISRPDEDETVKMLEKFLPKSMVSRIAKWGNVFLSIFAYQVSQRRPELMKKYLRRELEKELGQDYNIDKHFKPTYNPWDQRLCLVTNSDLFDAIKSKKVTMVTDQIDRFTASGVKMASGETVKADIVVTATGLQLLPIGGLKLSIDDEPVDISQKMVYKGIMFSEIPNLVSVTGYTNASWTLKADLSCAYFSRLVNHMDQKNYKSFVPTNEDPNLTEDDSLPLSAGYIARTRDIFPKQGNKRPWKLYQNYILDILSLRYSSLYDEAIKFRR